MTLYDENPLSHLSRIERNNATGYTDNYHNERAHSEFFGAFICAMLKHASFLLRSWISSQFQVSQRSCLINVVEPKVGRENIFFSALFCATFNLFETFFFSSTFLGFFKIKKTLPSSNSKWTFFKEIWVEKWSTVTYCHGAVCWYVFTYFTTINYSV